MIQLFSNTIGADELENIKEVFKSRWIGQGEIVKEFEKEFGRLINSSNVLMTNNCTSALFMACKLMDLKKGDEVLIPTINFIGVANAVASTGATPVFVDVNLDTLNIDVEDAISKLTNKCRAVIPIHYGGHPCNMKELNRLSKEYGLYIVEDSANSIISTYNGRNCGTIGNMGCFSFDAMKILSIGDGGAIVLDNKELYNKAISYRYLGFKDSSSGIDSLKRNKYRWWEFDIDTPAGRYTSNNILAAIALSQLTKLQYFVTKRKRIWEIYQKEFKDMVDYISLPPEPLPNTTSSYYFYWIKTNKRDELAKYLIDNDIYCTFRYFPLHLVPYYYRRKKVKLHNAEIINKQTLNIPLHQNLSDSDIDKIITTVRKFFRK